MSVYVTFHKPFRMFASEPVYTPLHVGKMIAHTELGIIGDNTGDHISAKNKTYSELTGLYWIWKNTCDDMVGLCHYRRYFMGGKPDLAMKLKKAGEFLLGKGRLLRNIYQVSGLKYARFILKKRSIDELLSQYDVIIPFEYQMRRTVREQFARRHNQKDLTLVENIIGEKYPAFLEAFHTCMEKKSFSPFNMFIMRRRHFESYMEWLFGILTEFESKANYSAYDSYQQRLPGFLAERLFNVWLLRSRLKVREMPILFIKD